MAYTPSDDKIFYKAAETSKDLYAYLTDGLNFNIDDVKLDPKLLEIPPELLDALSKDFPSVKLEDLTTKELDGTGVYDALMETTRKHLQREFEEGRITGVEYTKAYVVALQYCLQNATMFVLQKDKAYWDAIISRMNAISQQVNAFTAQVQLALAKAQVNTTKAQFANTVITLSTNDANFKAAQNNLLIQEEQRIATHEQAETYRAQTSDMRIDNVTPVKGTAHRQAKLYDQQVEAYVRDAELKAAKVWIDAWTTVSTIQDEVNTPDNFTVANVNKVLDILKKNNNLIKV